MQPLGIPSLFRKLESEPSKAWHNAEATCENTKNTKFIFTDVM